MKRSARTRWIRTVRLSLVALVVVFLIGYAAAQVGHSEWLRGSIHGAEGDVLGVLWPLAQSFDSPNGYGFTGDNSYVYLAQGDYGATIFYPPGYPFLLHVASQVVHDAERASQLVNAIGSVVFILATYLLALAWTAKRGVALLAAALLATSPAFLDLSYIASTDVLGQALGVAALAFALQSIRSPSTRKWGVAAAVALGTAYLIRRQVLVLLPPVVLISVWSARRHPREALIRTAAALGLIGILALVDMAVQVALHGDPLYSAHGKNLWNALINRFDWPAWHDVPNTISAVQVITSAPLELVRNWAGNVLYYAEQWWLGPATILALPGLYMMWTRPRVRERTVAVLGTVVLVVGVASMSERGDRHVAILVPTIATLGAAAVWYIVPRGRRALAASALVLVLAPIGIVQTAQLVNSLAIPQLGGVVRALQDDGASSQSTLAAFAWGDYAYYAGVEFEALPSSVDTWEELRTFMVANDVDYFLARGVRLHEKRLPEALEPATAPPWLEPIFVSPVDREYYRIVVYRAAETDPSAP